MKTNSASLITITCAFVMLCVLAGAAPQQADNINKTPLAGMGRVAYVDIDAITGKAKFAQELKNKIEGEYAVKMKSYKAKQDEYTTLLDSIKREETVLAEAAVNAKYKQAFLLKAQLDEEKFNMDKFMKDSEDKKAPAMERILDTIQKVAQDEGCDVVFRRELLIYGHPSADLSDKVVARLNMPQPAAKPDANEAKTPSRAK